MNDFIFKKPFWAHRIWSFFFSATIPPDNDAPVSTPVIDLKAISSTISHLLPKVQRQIVLDFGGDDDLPGE